MALSDTSNNDLLALQPSGNLLQIVGLFDENSPTTEIALSAGRVFRISTKSLLQQADHSLENLSSANDEYLPTGGEQKIPVIEERLEVGKRTVATGKVLLTKRVNDYDETLDVPLEVIKFTVDRVPMNTVVESTPAIRKEGATTIYPVVSEQVIVTKKLVLVEEVRVTEVHTVEHDRRVVTLSRENVEVVRTSSSDPRELL